MQGGGRGGAGSQPPNEYSCAQMHMEPKYVDFGDLTPYLTYGSERLAVNAKVATVLGSILASSESVESKERQ
jgi:hypothetical protein